MFSFLCLFYYFFFFLSFFLLQVPFHVHSSLQCMRKKLFVYVRFVAAVIFDFMTEEDWGEQKKQPSGQVLGRKKHRGVGGKYSLSLLSPRPLPPSPLTPLISSSNLEFQHGTFASKKFRAPEENAYTASAISVNHGVQIYPVDNISQNLISYPDLLLTKPEARSGQVKKINFLIGQIVSE